MIYPLFAIPCPIEIISLISRGCQLPVKNVCYHLGTQPFGYHGDTHSNHICLEFCFLHSSVWEIHINLTTFNKTGNPLLKFCLSLLVADYFVRFMLNSCWLLHTLVKKKSEIQLIAFTFTHISINNYMFSYHEHHIYILNKNKTKTKKTNKKEKKKRKKKSDTFSLVE